MKLKDTGEEENRLPIHFSKGPSMFAFGKALHLFGPVVSGSTVEGTPDSSKGFLSVENARKT